MIRPLTQADATEVASLIRVAFATLSAPVSPPPSALLETAGTIASIFAQGGGGAAAERDGRIVGTCIWQQKNGGLYVGRLSVAISARGQGIARALLAAAETEARRRGLPKLLLSTRLVLTDNRHLFASFGFTEVATHAHPGFTEPTFVDLEKPLCENDILRKKR